MSADDNDYLANELGRRAPYSSLGDWVILSGASPQACTLYWALMMHVNIKRGDHEVWPSRNTLAKMLGYARAKSIDPYVAELEKLGAVTVIRPPKVKGVASAVSRYIVHQRPPEGYGGLCSNADFYLNLKGVSAAQTRVPQEGHGGADVSAGQSVSAAQTRVPQEGHPVSPTGDTNKNEVNNTPSLLRSEGEEIDTPPATTKARRAPKSAEDQTDRRSVEPVFVLPEDWTPSSALVAWATGKGHSAETIEWESEGFVAYFAGTAKGRKAERTAASWDRSWKVWLQKNASDAPAPSSKPVVPAQASVFEAVDAEAGAVAEEVAVLWLQWSRSQGPVMPATDGRLRKLLAAAVEAGATREQLQVALKRCGEPCPPEWKFEKAMRGELVQGGGGVPQKSKDELWRAERAANRTSRQERAKALSEGRMGLFEKMPTDENYPPMIVRGDVVS